MSVVEEEKTWRRFVFHFLLGRKHCCLFFLCVSIFQMMRQMGGLGGMGGGAKPDFNDLDPSDEEGPDSDDEELPDLV